jgi:hypothetical protein
LSAMLQTYIIQMYGSIFVVQGFGYPLLPLVNTH